MSEEDVPNMIIPFSPILAQYLREKVNEDLEEVSQYQRNAEAHIYAFINFFPGFELSEITVSIDARVRNRNRIRFLKRVLASLNDATV